MPYGWSSMATLVHGSVLSDKKPVFAFTLTVYATDAWFNRVFEVGDLIRITSNDPLAELPPPIRMPQNCHRGCLFKESTDLPGFR